MYRRIRNLFDPKSKSPYTISRSRLELFTQCARCFYMDNRLGIPRPSFPPFTLNSAVDTLLKNEFDLLRKEGQSHELMKQYHIAAIPSNHPDLPKWRGDIPEYRWTGAQVLHPDTNLLITGLVDDIWETDLGELVIVDYKSTSTIKEISLEDEYKQAYKRQMEVYQWIFRHLGFKVCDTGYFVFANARKNEPRFDGHLIFDMSILAHKGDDSWVEDAITAAHDCLMSDKVPTQADSCEHCAYRKEAVQAVVNHTKTSL